MKLFMEAIQYDPDGITFQNGLFYSLVFFLRLN